MRVSKNQVTLLSAAVAALFAVSAQAQVTLTAAGTNVPAASYASEIAFTAPVTFATGATQNATGVIGIGASGGQNRYYRFDLTNATFAANSTAFAIGTGLLTGGTSAPLLAPVYATPTGSNVTLVASGTNFVVYQATAVPAGIAVTDSFAFVGSYILPAATSARLTMTTHETLVSATTQPNVTLLQTLSATVVNFAATLSFAMNSVKTETVAATTNFTKFCDNGVPVVAGSPGTAGCSSTATDTTAILGGIDRYGITAGRLTVLGAPITDMNTIATAGSLAVSSVGSDFTNTTAVGYGALADGNCGTALLGTVTVGTFPTLGAGVINTAKTLVTFPSTMGVGTTNVAAGGTVNRALCATMNGTSNIPAQTFNGVLTTTPNTGYTASTVTATGIGAWVRDGAELQSPWFSFGGTRYVSRFFFMNTGSSAAVCIPTTLSETGNVLTAGTAGTGFTIPAGGQIAVSASEIVASATGAGRAAVRFACAAPSASIQGRYVITDTLNGALDSGTLLRPGTN
jgi:hypothetical protein